MQLITRIKKLDLLALMNKNICIMNPQKKELPI